MILMKEKSSFRTNMVSTRHVREHKRGGKVKIRRPWYENLYFMSWHNFERLTF